MYEMIETRYYLGPRGMQEVVKGVLRSLGVPGNSAAVYESRRDSGYPGLVATSTMVDVSVQNKGLMKRIDEALKNLRFSEIK